MDELFNYLIKSKLFIADPDEKKRIDWYWTFAIGLLLTLCVIFFIWAIATLMVGYDGAIFAACISAGITMILVLSVVVVLFWTREGASKQLNLDDGTIMQWTGDVVVVPISWDPSWNIENKLYFCQKDRFFRDSATYMALYNDKKIIGYGEKISISLKEAKKLLKTPNKYVSDHAPESVDYYELRFYKKLDFKWEKPDHVPVRKQQYTSLDEIDPSKV